MQRVWTILIVVVALVALATRVIDLPLKPMHGDEANQAHKAGVLLEEGAYHYDPVEHHGPTLYYLTLPIAWLRGEHTFAETDEITYRIVPVIFSVLLILLLIPLSRGIGGPEALAAAALLSISPAFVYYSRYYIQEMLLAYFTLLTIIAAWRYVETRRIHWAIVAGIALGLMHATKETWVIAVAAMLAAALLLLVPSGKWRNRRTVIVPKHIFIGGFAGALVSIVLFSSFFSNWRGPVDSIMTYATYLHRAGNEGEHNKPFLYYLQLLAYAKNGPGPWWSEAFILVLAGVGGFVAAFSPARYSSPCIARFIALYTVFATLAYSIVPYKTPWCVLTFMTGMIVLAGMGAVALLRGVPGKSLKVLTGVLLIAGTYHLSVQAYRANATYPADRTNPYVYAHTVNPFMRLVKDIDDLAKVSPDGHATFIRVFRPDSDYWPLPFYVRAFTKVGYWVSPDDEMDAPIIITAPAFQSMLTPHLKEKYQISFVGFRPENPMLLYIRQDLADALITYRQQHPPQ